MKRTRQTQIHIPSYSIRRASNNVQWYVIETAGAIDKIIKIFYNMKDAENYISLKALLKKA